jgi:mediator of RNA polymerase II transcription subunit 1
MRNCTGLYTGGGGLGGGGGNHHSGPGLDFEPEVKLKLEGGVGGGLVGRGGGPFVTDTCLSETTFEPFSTESGELTVTSLQFPTATLSGEKKRKKRRGGSELWVSPKRSRTESCSSDSSPLGTPTSTQDTPQSCDLETTPVVGLEGGIEGGADLDDVEELLKASLKKPRKEKKSASEILFELENKNLVPPSVSITPISSSQINSQNLNSVLTGMGLERRPGIEIIPIVAAATTSLSSSITITPISSKGIAEDRLKSERKGTKTGGRGDEKSRLEKKRKRKREEGGGMGPPEKVPPKADPLFKPVSVSIKPADSSSPRSSSPMPKYSGSPTPLTIVGKGSPKSKQSPKHSPAYPTSSPKNSVTSSPKHGTSSPKHQSSSGKPSMSTLKSAVSSPGKSESKNKSKEGREKERKGYGSTGRSSPKPKSLTGSSGKGKEVPPTPDLPQSSQSGGSTPPSGDGGKSSAPHMRNRKSSLSAVIDKLKSAQHCGEGEGGKPKERSNSGKAEGKGGTVKAGGEPKSGEYMVKPSSDGMKLTINKTRTKDSSKMKSGSGSPKTHTGLKPGVNSGPASKKPQQKSSSGSLVKSGSGKTSSLKSSLVKSGSSSNRSQGSPKTDPNRPRDKPRPPKSDKSIFSVSKSDAKTRSPTSEPSDGYKSAPLAISPQLVVEGLMKPLLDTKFQIPKLSARNSNPEESKKEKSSDSCKALEIGSAKVPCSGPKNLEELRVSVVDSKQKCVSSSSSIVSVVKPHSPNISIIPVSSVEKEEKEGEDPYNASLKIELPISARGVFPESSTDDAKKDKPLLLPSTQEAAELLLDFSSSAPSKTTEATTTKLVTVSDRAISVSSVRRNTPPPFPASPSVSVHILKSPAPSPLVIRSPPSSSPCITDDELMDEAVVGIGK